MREGEKQTSAAHEKICQQVIARSEYAPKVVLAQNGYWREFVEHAPSPFSRRVRGQILRMCKSTRTEIRPIAIA